MEWLGIILLVVVGLPLVAWVGIFWGLAIGWPIRRLLRRATRMQPPASSVAPLNRYYTEAMRGRDD